MSTGAINGNAAINLDAYINQLHANSNAGAHGDLASFVLVEQLRSQDQAIHSKMNQVRLTSAARKQINEKLSALRELQVQVRAKAGGDDDKKVKTNEVAGWSGEHNKKLELDIDSKTGTVRRRSGDTGKLTQDGEITANIIGAEIKRLEGKANDLTSDREISMIQLNSSISKRGTMVQLLSSLTKQTNDTQRSVVSNFR